MNNNANANIMHVEAIEGLAQQINEHLEASTADTVEQHEIKEQAIKNLAEWQKTDLHDLRRAYE